MNRISRVVLTCIASLFAGPAFAADLWIAGDLHGSVVTLVNNQWAELLDGDHIASGATVRTLDRGHVVLSRGNETLQLGPQATIRSTTSGDSITIEQFAGSISFTNPGTAHYTLVLSNLTAILTSVSLASRISPTGTTLAVRKGRASIVSHGQTHMLAPGETIMIGPNGVALTSATGVGASTTNAITDAAGSVAAEPPATTSETKADNGVGNGGVPGNGGQNNNGNKGGNGRGGK